MQIPEYIQVNNSSDQKAAFLSPQSDGLKDCYIDTRLNGESTLEFYLPLTSEKWADLTPECQIIAGGRRYSLLKDEAIDHERNENNKLWGKVMAVELWKELETQYPEPYISNDPTTPVPADLAVIIVGGGSDLSGGRFAVGSAGHALYAILNGSGWSVGTVDVPGTYDLEAEKASRLELVRQVQDIWGGYLLWDSMNKVVHLRSGNNWQPYNGFQIRYAKNLKHITRTQSNRLVTKLYPFGKDDLDIASVNGGKKYITNNSYTPREYVGIYKNQNISDAQELLEKATDELALSCKPRYNYKIKMVDLRTLPEYSHEDFSLGDMTDVIDPAIGTARVRIIRHKYNVFRPWECELELGDPEERLIESLKASFDTSRFVGSIYNNSGKTSGYYIEDLSISADKIQNLSIDTNKIQNFAVTSDKISNGAITASKISDFAVTASKISDLTITADKIANLTITGDKIANATITNAKIVSLSADKITAGTITATVTINSPIINTGSIYGSKFYGENTNSAYLIIGAGDGTNYGDLKLYRGSGNNPVFSVYDDISVISLRAGTGGSPYAFLNTDGETTRPLGVWDCSNAVFMNLTDEDGSQYATRDWCYDNFLRPRYSGDDIRLNIVGSNLEVWEGTTFVGKATLTSW